MLKITPFYTWNKDFCKRDLRSGRQTSENQTIAIIDVEQYAATFPGHSGILDWIDLIISTGHIRFFIWYYLMQREK